MFGLALEIYDPFENTVNGSRGACPGRNQGDSMVGCEPCKCFGMKVTFDKGEICRYREYAYVTTGTV